MSRRLVLVLLALGAALAFPGTVGAARVAVGLKPGADADKVAAAIERRTGNRAARLSPIPALAVELPAGVSLRGISGIRYVERTFSRRLAHDSHRPARPAAVVPDEEPVLRDVDEPAAARPGARGGHRLRMSTPTHPELDGKILSWRSFVGGTAREDTLGHGTFVSGIIAAGLDNKIGIAGLAPSAELLVAKVVTGKRIIPVEAVAKAIRWAVANGARVINMSFGGVRDPLDPERDTFSQLEADAVAYAVSNGVVVVAPVGNGDQSPQTPWPYASYPAALPHVLGVSAVAESGGVPKFSNRDQIFNDLAAPGERILSTFPRPLTSRFPACSEQGYSSCGPDEYREAQGTSFAAPLASAAAALLLSVRPGLRPEQVNAILQHTAVDMTQETGCKDCIEGPRPALGLGPPGRRRRAGGRRAAAARCATATSRTTAPGRAPGLCPSARGEP